MSEYRTELQWRRAQHEPFVDNRYSRLHQLRFDGGAEWLASSSPLVVPLPFSDASAVDPEEMLVAALSSCHMLWFLNLAATAGYCVDHYEDQATGVMAADATKRIWMQAVSLRPRVRFSGSLQPNAAQLQKLHEQAHDACFIANSVKTEVRCEPRI